MTDRALSALIHGSAGAGKTNLAVSGPKPLLFLDVEKASRFVKARKIKWNPLESEPPVDDGTWDICVVNISDWNRAIKAYEYLKSRRHPFKSVVIDSISELQSKAMENIKGRKAFQMQDWGKLLADVSFFCRDLRDLAGDDDNTIESVVITAMSKEYDGVVKPYLQGQISAQAPYWFDITGYLYVTQETDPTTGEIVEIRNLLVGNHPNFEAKSRVPGLPSILQKPTITGILDAAFGPEEVVPEKVSSVPAAQAKEASKPVKQAPESSTGLPEIPSN